MRFIDHSRLAGSHAFLSASKSAWVEYSDDKFDRVFLASQAAARGSKLHDLAADMIRMGVKAAANRTTFSMYVNDAIGYGMTPEQTLFYSEHAYGTTDAISFKRNKVRIHDYKSGVTPTHPRQLVVYGGLFCLEYDLKPSDIDGELRIYQNDEVRVFEWDPVEISRVIDRIVYFDQRIRTIMEELEG